MRDLLPELLSPLAPDVAIRVAFHRGVAAILLAIAITLSLVGVLMAACGCGLWCTLIGVPVLAPAAAFAGWASLLRTMRR